MFPHWGAWNWWLLGMAILCLHFLPAIITALRKKSKNSEWAKAWNEEVVATWKYAKTPKGIVSTWPFWPLIISLVIVGILYLSRNLTQ